MLSAHSKKNGDGQVPVVRLIHGSFSSFSFFSFFSDSASFACSRVTWPTSSCNSTG